MVRSVGNQGLCSNKELCIKESDKTIRAREKLKKGLEKLEGKVTQEALKKKIVEIHDRISRTAPERVHVSKGLQLFDNNQTPAKVSPKVLALFAKIKENNENNALYIETLDETYQTGLVDHQVEEI